VSHFEIEKIMNKPVSVGSNPQSNIELRRLGHQRNFAQ